MSEEGKVTVEQLREELLEAWKYTKPTSEERQAAKVFMDLFAGWEETERRAKIKKRAERGETLAPEEQEMFEFERELDRVYDKYERGETLTLEEQEIWDSAAENEKALVEPNKILIEPK